ncbi:MAG: hypothetical protein MJZ98_00105 [Paludibacteraceae bacterium]|nr:hypothetical protein [Paludibacteraceae bacterium]
MDHTFNFPIGFVNRMPMPYAPTFYMKVVDLVQGIEADELMDTVSVFCDSVSEFTTSLESDAQVDHEEIVEAFQRLRKLWTGTHRIFQGYTQSVNPAEALMAKKALSILKYYRQKTFKRTNAAENLIMLTNTITSAWTSAELQGTFIEEWRKSLVTAATDYADRYQRRIDRTNNHRCATDFMPQLFANFHFLFYSLYIYCGNTGDVAVSEIYENIKELVRIYSSIVKAHKTRVANRNRPTDTPDNTEEEIQKLLRQAESLGSKPESGDVA